LDMIHNAPAFEEWVQNQVNELWTPEQQLDTMYLGTMCEVRLHHPSKSVSRLLEIRAKCQLDIKSTVEGPADGSPLNKDEGTWLVLLVFKNVVQHQRQRRKGMHLLNTDQTDVPPQRIQLPQADLDLQRPCVTLNTKEAMLRHFALTPDMTVDQLIAESVTKLNRRGKGCCLWHVGLTSLNQRISCLLQQGCRKKLVSFVPGRHWQCQTCKIVHDENLEHTTDDDSNLCDFCDCEQSRQPMLQLDTYSEPGLTLAAQPHGSDATSHILL